MTTVAEVGSRELHDELVGRARTLAPGFRERIGETEDGRQVPRASIDEVLEAGFARILLPQRFGGYELWLDAWFDVSVEIGKACASTAWCSSLLAHVNHILSNFPQEAQETVWADGPDVCIAHSIAPTARVERVDGGFRISGEHPFASGVDHADWAIVGGLIHGEGGPPEWGQFLVPPGEFTILDTWQAAGMRGTGSKTIVTDDVFVPETSHITMSGFLRGETPGGQVNAAKQYKLPFVMIGGPTFLGPMLGAGRGAYERFVEDAEARPPEKGARFADRWSVQETISRAAVDLDLAELLIRRNLDFARNQDVTVRDRARTIRDWTRASELIREATDRLAHHAGTRGMLPPQPMQQYWRDVNVIARHKAFDPEYNLSYFGRLELGLERDPAMGLY